jgi:hypothetical protein
METITLARREASIRAKQLPAGSVMPRARLAEIFSFGDGSVHPIPNLASAGYQIRKFHAGGADLILIGTSKVQGMKIGRDSWGFITVLIGLGPANLPANEADDEVLVAFAQGALRPAGVIGFLWDGEKSPESRPPESNPVITRSRLEGVRQLRRRNLT